MFVCMSLWSYTRQLPNQGEQTDSKTQVFIGEGEQIESIRMQLKLILCFPPIEHVFLHVLGFINVLFEMLIFWLDML